MFHKRSHRRKNYTTVNICTRIRSKLPLAHHLFTLILNANPITTMFIPIIDGIVAVKSGFKAFTLPGSVTNDRIINPRIFSIN